MLKKEKVKNVRWVTLMKAFLSGPKGLKTSQKSMCHKDVCVQGLWPTPVAKQNLAF